MYTVDVQEFNLAGTYSSRPRGWLSKQMRSLTLFLGTAACSLGLFMLFLAYCKRKQKVRNVNDRESINEVIFFPDKATAELLTSSNQDNLEKGSLAILMKTLQSAKQSLNVCMFTFSCRELSDILIEAHQHGVVVRVITDNEQSHSSGSQIEKLRRSGIQVRTDEGSYFMHHKFVIVDEQLLVTGSLNWTLQGICGNQENVIITNLLNLVQPFLSQFECLWTSYDPES